MNDDDDEEQKRRTQKIEFNIFPASHRASARGTLISCVHGCNIMYLCNAYYYRIYANQDNKEKQATCYEEIFCSLLAKQVPSWELTRETQGRR